MEPPSPPAFETSRSLQEFPKYNRIGIRNFIICWNWMEKIINLATLGLILPSILPISDHHFVASPSLAPAPQWVIMFKFKHFFFISVSFRHIMFVLSCGFLLCVKKKIHIWSSLVSTKFICCSLSLLSSCILLFVFQMFSHQSLSC